MSSTLEHVNYIAGLLPWSDGSEITTPRGARISRVALCDAATWVPFFNEHKPYFTKWEVSLGGIKDGTLQINWLAPIITSEDTGAVRKREDISPEIAARCREYQVPIVAEMIRGLRKHRFMFNGSDMGTGKMYMDSAVVAQTGLEPIVIARKAAIPDWKKVLKFMGTRRTPTVTNVDQIKREKENFGRWVEWKAKNGRKMKRFEWRLPKDAILLLDEVHWYRGSDSDNSKLLIAVRDEKVFCVGSSGTAASTPMHMKGLGYVLGLHDLKGYWKWMLNHGVAKGKFGLEFSCGMKWNQLVYYNKGEKVLNEEGQKELHRRRCVVMQQIHNQIFPTGRGVRVNKCEVPGFPVNTIIPYRIDYGQATGEIQFAYERLKDRLRSVKANERFSCMMESLMEIEKVKLMGVVDDIDEALAEGNSVLVFVNFNDSVDTLARHYKTDMIIRGGQTEEARESVKQRFQLNREKLCILNNKAGGESISMQDLHGGHPRVSIVFPSFWVEPIVQCLWRTARDGAKSPVICKIPFAADTPEENALINFQSSVERIAALNDGQLQGLFGL